MMTWVTVPPSYHAYCRVHITSSHMMTHGWYIASAMMTWAQVIMGNGNSWTLTAEKHHVITHDSCYIKTHVMMTWVTAHNASNHAFC